MDYKLLINGEWIESESGSVLEVKNKYNGQIVETLPVASSDTPDAAIAAAERADHMPYGDNRQSRLGREGVKFAMEDMTNIQMIAIRLT